MKIPDISKIDMKDIDFGKIKNEILDHKETAVQVILVIVSLFFMVSVITASQAGIKKYKNQITALLAKTGLIEEYKKVEQEIKDFLSKVPAHVPEDKMVNLVADLAGKNNVKILTFSQAKIDKKDTIETTAVTFSLTADSFINMVKFLVDIEKGKEFLQVWSCPIAPRMDAGGKQKDKSGVPINFKIEVVSVKVKEP